MFDSHKIKKKGAFSERSIFKTENSEEKEGCKETSRVLQVSSRCWTGSDYFQACGMFGFTPKSTQKVPKR